MKTQNKVFDNLDEATQSINEVNDPIEVIIWTAKLERTLDNMPGEFAPFFGFDEPGLKSLAKTFVRVVKTKQIPIICWN